MSSSSAVVSPVAPLGTNPHVVNWRRWLIAAWLLSIACLLLRNADAAVIPTWLVFAFELSPENAAVAYRIQLAALLASAGAIALLRIAWRPFAIIAIAWLIFTDIAAASSGSRNSVVLMLPHASAYIIIPVHALLLLIAMSGKSPRTPPLLRISPAWRFTAILTVFCIAAGVAGRTEVQPLNPKRLDAMPKGNSVVKLKLDEWLNTPLSETALAAALPDLSPRPPFTTQRLILIHPDCAKCLEIFDLYHNEFAQGDVVVINLDAPDENSTEAKVRDLCPNAREFTLPQNKIWVVESPALLKIENGIITCTAIEDLEPCMTE